MYNQNSVATGAKWFFFLAFVVLAGAFALGANIQDATWLNRDIAAAQADRISIENAHQQATYELQERLETAKTEADIREIERQQARLDAQYQHDIQALSQDLAHQDIAFRTWMTILTILAGAFALALFVSATFWVGSKAWVYIQSNSRKEEVMAKVAPTMEKRIPNLPEREAYDPWADPNYRQRMKTAAKNQERKGREEQWEAELLEVRMSHFSDPAKMSGNKRNQLPQAGD